ncbi:MAG: alpha/beta hydrolase, partial [Corynebacterium matruchotii]
MNENDRVSDSWEEEDRAAFQVGGVDRELSPEQQLEQLATYIHAHYEAPAKNPPWSDDPSDPVAADTFDARLPDRLTHSAMLMLGAAVDHSMPGVAFAQGVTAQSVPEINAQVFVPESPNGRYAVSLHPGGWWKGSGVALENAWRPEVAAVAQLSGVTMVDVDYPLVPEASLPEVMSAVA